jgi:hypothetical protein
MGTYKFLNQDAKRSAMAAINAALEGDRHSHLLHEIALLRSHLPSMADAARTRAIRRIADLNDEIARLAKIVRVSR